MDSSYGSTEVTLRTEPALRLDDVLHIHVTSVPPLFLLLFQRCLLYAAILRKTLPVWINSIERPRLHSYYLYWRPSGYQQPCRSARRSVKRDVVLLRVRASERHIGR